MIGAKPPSLSRRQARALALVAQGWTFPEIGSRLKIAPRVVLLYLVHLQRYLETPSPGELTRALLQARLLPVEWARAQTRRGPGRKPSSDSPPAVPAGPPVGKPRVLPPARVQPPGEE